MASVIALLDAAAFKKHAKHAVPGAVLPIDSFVTSDRSFATELSRGGALYLVTAGKTPSELWLVAVLEAPQTSGIKKGDKRKPGWYSPQNTTPVTDVSRLRGKLKIGKDLAAAFAQPRILTPEMDRVLREILDALDAPVIAHGEPTVKAPVLDPKSPPLDRAAQYLAGGHLTPAIEAIAEAWRDSHAPVLADLIDRATRLTPEYHRPLFDKRMSWDGDKEAAKIWNAAFDSDPVAAMPQLLLNLAVGGGASAILERTKRLAKLPLDPRLGARLVELQSERPWAQPNWWPPIIDVWLASKDARTFESILELESEEMHFGPRTSKLYAMARGTPPKLPATDQPAVTRIEAELHRLEEPYRTECSLVDQIAAHPDDDGSYLVYADWLLERGRPLGEYITLTCQQRTGALSPAQARRLAMLVEVPYLCGAFDDLPARRVRARERGIDRDVSVYWSTRPRSWRLFAASPLARALTRVSLTGSPLDHREQAIAEFVKAAPALERLDDIGTKARGTKIAKLVGGTFELQVTTLTVSNDYGYYNSSETTEKRYDLVRVTRGGRSR
jgi:uncharacterized protein (TIGR02996 family)